MNKQKLSSLKNPLNISGIKISWVYYTVLQPFNIFPGTWVIKACHCPERLFKAIAWV
jgi:hypothetical protein